MMPQAASQAIELHLMNGFELRCAGKPAAPPLAVQRVFAFLALQGRPVQRLYVAGRLWPDSSEPRAMASLRSALWRAKSSALAVIRAMDSRLTLDPGVRIDVREASAQAQRLIEGSAADDVGFAGELLCGELLPDWYDDWLLIERERFRQLRLHALEALSARLVGVARYGEAAETALSAIAAEPLRESAHRTLIHVFLAEGNPSEALRHYEQFRRLLRTELGLEPSTQMRGLVDTAFARNAAVTARIQTHPGA
jgi:DNA-binding SARP family transcriptional activator